MKEVDVWPLAVADRGFLRLVVYPEDDTGGGALRSQDLSGCGRQEDEWYV